MYIKHISLFRKIFNVSEKENNVLKFENQKAYLFDDSIKLSNDARKKLDFLNSKVKDIIHNVPDIRKSKVEELKIKINDENYIKSIDYNLLVQKMIKFPFRINKNFFKS